MVTIKCKSCGKYFEVRPSYIKRGRKFCSPRCQYDSFIKKRLKFTCKFCKKDFFVTEGVAKYKRLTYCSQECRTKDRTRVQKCETCGKIFIVGKSSKIKFCSRKCMGLGKRTRTIEICPICGKEFYAVPSRRGKIKTCSRKCMGIAQRTGDLYGMFQGRRVRAAKAHCLNCGKEFLHEFYKPRSFCSRKCSNNYEYDKTASIEKMKLAFGKKLLICKCATCGKAKRYYKRYIDKFPTTVYFCTMKCLWEYYGVHPEEEAKLKGSIYKTHGYLFPDKRRDYVYRNLAEEMLGRSLHKGERVHHIDCDRTHNAKSNFYVYKNNGEHTKGHGTLNKLVELLLKDKFVEFKDGNYYLGKRFHQLKAMQ